MFELIVISEGSKRKVEKYHQNENHSIKCFGQNFDGQNISSDKIFVGQNFSTDKIFDTNPKNSTVLSVEILSDKVFLCSLTGRV